MNNPIGSFLVFREGRSRKLRRHLVPLSPLAVELIQVTLAARGRIEFLFPTTQGWHVDDVRSGGGLKPLTSATRSAWYQYPRSPPHGFGAHEETGIPPCCWLGAWSRAARREGYPSRQRRCVGVRAREASCARSLG